MEVRPYVEAKVAHPTIDAESSLPRGPHDEGGNQIVSDRSDPRHQVLFNCSRHNQLVMPGYTVGKVEQRWVLERKGRKGFTWPTIFPSLQRSFLAKFQKFPEGQAYQTVTLLIPWAVPQHLSCTPIPNITGKSLTQAESSGPFFSMLKVWLSSKVEQQLIMPSLKDCKSPTRQWNDNEINSINWDAKILTSDIAIQISVDQQPLHFHALMRPNQCNPLLLRDIKQAREPLSQQSFCWGQTHPSSRGLPQVTADSEKMEEHGSEISQAIYQRAIGVPRDPKRPLVTKQITRNVRKRCDTDLGIDGLKTVAERRKYDGN
ncbi:hypothetical protein Bbelb_367640 [Branchiostoma belcheri]|nr:hypothetical protein Bbelb_367640 [Branchiostoma belcheri]